LSLGDITANHFGATAFNVLTDVRGHDDGGGVDDAALLGLPKGLKVRVKSAAKKT